MTSLIKVPFASSGDKTAVPDTDTGGSVNMTQGYGQNYSLDPATDPSAKRIEREKMNWLFNIITSAINEIQVSGVTPFITSTDNGGSPFSYGKGAIVSLGGAVYQSLTAANATTPPGASWSLIPEKIQPLDATLTALASLIGGADKLPYFNGDDSAALTALTSVGREIIGKTTISDVLTYLTLGTAAKKDVGTGTGQIPDMSSFVFTGEDLGSYRLPGGMIAQWAHLTSLDSTGWTLVNFQNAWPTKILGAIAINEAGTVLADKIMGVKRLTDTQLQITCIARDTGSPGSGGAYVIAWGK